MLSTRVAVGLASLAACLCATKVCEAQPVETSAPAGQNYANAVRTQDVRSYTARSEAARSIRSDFFGRSATSLGGGGSQPVRKPFSNTTNRPTVSPYINLLREDIFDNDAVNYYGIVRPQLNQIRTNQRVQQQGQQIYRQLQALQGKAAFPVQGSDNLFPTGHQFAYLNYLHYYRMPAPSQQQ